MALSNGTNIKWTSSAAGKSKTKQGEIIRHVPKGVSIFAMLHTLGVPRARYSGAITQDKARGDRYLVKVGQDYYAPQAVRVERQNQGARTVSVQPEPPPQAPLAKPAASNPWPFAQPSAWTKPLIPVLDQAGNVVAMQQAPEPPKVEAPKRKLVNRIVLILDRSGSMNPIIGPAIAALNRHVKTIKEESAAAGQDTTISVYTFADSVKALYLDQPASKAPEISSDAVRVGGSTALFDAVGEGISHLKTQQDAPNVSNLLIVATDGEENRSAHYHAESLKTLMRSVEKTDRWTLAFLVPPGGKRELVDRFGIAEGNVKEWSATVKGVQEAEQATDLGLRSYFGTRAAGKTKTTTFYTDLSKVAVDDVRQLDDLSAQFKSWTVDAERDIRVFAEFYTKKPYVPGSMYYALTKPEEVQDHKGLVVMIKGERKVYGGPRVRALLGLPATGTVRVKPGNHANFDIFVQSKSLNRILVRGTKMLFDAKHTTASAPTWVPPAPATV